MPVRKAKTAKPLKTMSFSQQDTELASKVKRANQRLRELEKQGLVNSPAYKAAERIALKGDKMTGTTKSGQIKFNTNIRSLSESERRALEREVDRFLSAETSTVKGSKEVARRAREAYRKSAKGAGERKEETGLTMPSIDLDDIPDEELDDWLNLWGTAAASQAKALYGSDFTEFLINNLIKSDLDKDEAEQFITDHYGEPLVEYMDDIEGIWEEAGEDTPWSWNDIFTEG